MHSSLFASVDVIKFQIMDVCSSLDLANVCIQSQDEGARVMNQKNMADEVMKMKFSISKLLYTWRMDTRGWLSSEGLVTGRKDDC
jgi:hypothetical protein